MDLADKGLRVGGSVDLYCGTCVLYSDDTPFHCWSMIMSKDSSILTDVSCPSCCSVAESLTVIDNEELLLAIDFTGPDALALASAKRAEVEQRFPDAQVLVSEHGGTVRVDIEFSCGVEKLIFQRAERSRTSGGAAGRSG